MEIDIDTLSVDELILLNQRIVARLKFLESSQTHAEMLQFDVGQKVSFQPSGRDRQVGTLVTYNRKTVTVIPVGQRRNVSPHLLSAVKDVKKGHTNNRNLIDLRSK